MSKAPFIVFLATLATLSNPAIAQTAQPKLLKIEFVEVKGGDLVYKATYDADLTPGSTDAATDLLKTTLKSARTLNGSSGASISGKTAVLRIGLDEKAAFVKSAPVLQSLTFVSSVGARTSVYEASFSPSVPAKSTVPDAIAKAAAYMDAAQRGHKQSDKDDIKIGTKAVLQSNQTTVEITLQYSGGVYDKLK